MKTNICVSLSIEVATLLNKTAQFNGISVSKMVDIILRRGLGMDRQQQQFSKIQNQVISALQVLKEAQAPSFRFSVTDVTKELGMYPSEVIGTLKELCRMGVLESMTFEGNDIYWLKAIGSPQQP